MAPRTAIKSANESTRLDPDAWIAAALDILAEEGIGAVRIEPLAKRLAVTKGSFYWHFKDRDALCEAILNHWRRRATLDIIARLDRAHEAPAARLKQLLFLPFGGARSTKAAEVELSIRLWGRRDARARDALKEIDELRLRYITGLLVELGQSRSEATARAVLAYSFMRVGATLIQRKDEQTLADCMSAILKT